MSEIKLRSQTEVHEEVFSVIELVNHILVTAEIEAEVRKQTIKMHIDTSLELKTDRHLVLSALGNLVQNALKYTKIKGNVTISARSKGDKVEIEVGDECGGISPSKIEEMFKPFSQFNADKSGLGLGLAISRKAIAHCGGEISAHNTPGGCIFKISLPILKPTSSRVSVV